MNDKGSPFDQHQQPDSPKAFSPLLEWNFPKNEMNELFYTGPASFPPTEIRWDLRFKLISVRLTRKECFRLLITKGFSFFLLSKFSQKEKFKKPWKKMLQDFKAEINIFSSLPT